MATPRFSENNLKGIFGDFECNKTHDAWILKKKLYNGSSCEIIIEKNKIIDLLNKLNKSQEIKFENLSFYKKMGFGSTIKTYFEHPIRIVYEHPSLKIKSLNSATSRLSVSSLRDEYSLLLYLSNPLDKLAEHTILNLDLKLIDKYPNQTIDFWDVIQILNEEILKLNSLKIESIIYLSQNEINRLTKAYLFYCAYHNNAILDMNSIFKKSYPLYPNKNFYIPEEKILKLDVEEELLNYYQRAIRLNDPFESFISFYHIFEYFFKIIEDEFKRNINLKVTNQFDGSEQEFRDIILMNTLNERKLLQLVFRRFLDKELLKVELNYIKRDYYSYLETHGVKFASKPTKTAKTKLNDNTFYDSLTERIYSIRNALVHRKEGFNEPKYLPFKKEHKDELREEFLLMKAIANQIIIRYSNRKKQ